MKYKAALLDFDGTIATNDVLSRLCAVVGKEEESEKLNAEFFSGKRKGISALVERINFLKGVTLSQISAIVEESPSIMPGAHELFDFFHKHNITTVLHSGNLISVLEYYQQELGIDYLVGSRPQMDGEKIVGISEEEYSVPVDFKLHDVQSLVEEMNILPSECIAIGDSPADKALFDFAGLSIAINPKNGVEEYADEVIENDLSLAIPIIAEQRKAE